SPERGPRGGRARGGGPLSPPLPAARKSLAETGRSLTAVCMGREPADLLIRNGRLVCVHTREVLDGVDVAVRHGRFAEAVLPRGTTTAFIDNHEMANVFGLDGIRWMLEEGRRLPLKVFLAVPSCVPALPGFEDAGAVFGPAEIAAALEWE